MISARPLNMTHAWAAPATTSADVLVIFTPGIERFDYFRLGDRIRKGQANPHEILDTQSGEFALLMLTGVLRVRQL